jgi:hypothetical protein
MSTSLTVFDGWDLDVAAVEEPRVRDVDVAARGGMRRPRDVRQLIERNRAEIEKHGALEVRGTAPQTSGGRPGLEYWLTEAQSFTVVALMRTAQAASVRFALVQLFVGYRRGQVPPAPAPTLPSAAPVQSRLSDDARSSAFLRGWVSTAAKLTGRSNQSIQGELRRPWGVASLYRIPLVALDHTIATIQLLLREHASRKRLPAAPRKQVDLPFPAPDRPS